MLNEYIEQVNKRFITGISTEHTFRGDLQILLESFDNSVLVTNEPTRIQCGAPDFIITKKSIPLGYIEAKDIGISLKKTEKTDQLKRYRDYLDNLILTDYLNFWFYRNRKKVASIAIAEIKDNKIVPLFDSFEDFRSLITDFLSHINQSIKSPLKLAEMMAGKAKMMQSVIEKAVTSDELNYQDSTLKDQMLAFKKLLIHDIKPSEFADIYAQTIAYGMFAARLHDRSLDNFSRQEAAELIPKSNPFLRSLFGYIAGPDIDDRIVWIVDALAHIFRAVDLDAIIKDFGSSTQLNDPVIHFYETFLSIYNPKLRKKRGVWYTPEPVVNFIVRAIDDILKTDFDLTMGLADTSKIKIRVQEQGAKGKINKNVHKVQILDPATGTGTFLAEIVKQIYNKFQGQQGIWSSYVENHLIPRLNGFEILMASYAMAHLKLDLLLNETGFNPRKQNRFRIFLTNSLEESHPDTGTLFATWLSREATEANFIKRDTPVMVVLGNPPYSGESVNKGEWIMKLMEDYKKEPGGKEKLKERNPKWINDDYVKFIRYSQYFIDKNSEGVLAFINNHSFLDNPTFRGMRWSLLNSFNKIYIIDLHGNVKKKEACPDGSTDKNVFDIQQGVSINIFVKTDKKKKLSDVYHYDLYGLRESKYDFLRRKSIRDIEFEKLKLTTPQYFFVRNNFGVKIEYVIFFSINRLFTIISLGIVTSRDAFVTDNSKESLIGRIKNFFILDPDSLKLKYNLKENKSWKINLVQNKVHSFHENQIKKIIYRPFEKRYIFFNVNFIERPRIKVMQHLFKNDNLGLIVPRQAITDNWSHIQVTDSIVDNRVHYSNKGIPVVCPLYLYPLENPQKTFKSSTKRKPNLDDKIVQQIAKSIKLKFTPEKEETDDAFAPIDILDYIYATLHSKKYREKYNEFLKIDFPRVPFPKNAETFWKLVKLGSNLRSIHLLENPIVEQRITTYPKEGDNVVTRKIVKKDYEINNNGKMIGRIWINDIQYFDNIPETTWEFYIGGYQPAQKWLKDRIGVELTPDDIFHYQKIIVALGQTALIMQEIDNIDFM